MVLADFMAEPKGNLMHYMKRIKPQVIGITSQCTDVENVLKIAEMAKRYDKDIKVIVGGVQAMVYPNSFLILMLTMYLSQQREKITEN